jgi:tetratricopeptide (TPR) repeat protein
MINDFDLLLKQCKSRAIKRIMRITLRVVGSILLIIVATMGYWQWQENTHPIVVKKIKPITVQAVLIPEANTTTTPVIVPEANKSIPTVAIKTSPAPVTATAIQKPIISATIKETPSAPTTNRLLEVSNVSSTPMTPEQIYQRSPKFETALGIARDFYTKEDYAQAATWAKKSNQMNREAEEAWLLYAKSYYAQGKKTEAIAVLELFLNYKDSKAASELIKTWR